MHSPSIALGLGGLGLTLAAWISEGAFETSSISWSFLAMISICALGGLLPVRLPGLHPMPISLPIVGALAVTSGAPAAMAAGFGAGLATIIAPREEADSLRSRWQAGWALGGALALAAGMAASGFSLLGLRAIHPAIPSAPAPEEMLRYVPAIALAFFLAWIASRAAGLDRAGESHRVASLGRGLAACALLAPVTATLASLWLGWHEVVWACLACAELGALLMSRKMLQQGRDLRAAQGRARTGLALVEALALAIEAKDRTSERHLRRMRIYSVETGRRLGMSPEELESLEYAALLHDIGKLVVPESILSKPAGLSSQEFQMMSTHAKVGAAILETTSLSESVAAMVRHHHERYDGSGYPDGLVGMEIPLGARILTAADTFEALTSDRPYRRRMSVREAVAYLEKHAGTLFDPRVVRVLVEHHSRFEDLVVAEEKSRTQAGARMPEREDASARATAQDPKRTRQVRPPFQAVLDRIASSHTEIYSLHEITHALGKTLNLEESFTLVVAKIQRLIHYSSCAIYVLDPETDLLRPRFASGPGASKILEMSIPIGQRISGWAALQKRPVTCATSPSTGGMSGGRSDFEAISGHPELAPLTSCLAAPLLIEEALVGVIALYDFAEHEYTAQEEQLLGLIGRQVAGAVRTGLLFEQTQEHALTDSLTGLPNSRYMFISFDQEAARAREEAVPLTLLVMDIDNFREINDDFGHHAGDRFLVGMAKTIRSQMRVCDTCIRYAGDEFVAILPRLAGEEVERVVDRITEAARDYCMEARPGRPVQLALSVGFATMPDDGDDFETLISVATGRMEKQKSSHWRPEKDRLAAVPLCTFPAGKKH